MPLHNGWLEAIRKREEAHEKMLSSASHDFLVARVTELEKEVCLVKYSRDGYSKREIEARSQFETLSEDIAKCLQAPYKDSFNRPQEVAVGIDDQAKAKCPYCGTVCLEIPITIQKP